MKEINFYEKCIKRDGEVCGICKKSISEDLKKYREYTELQAEIRRQKRALQAKVKGFREKIDIDIDHIVPRSKGGRMEVDNIQITHRLCNKKKGDKLLD